jgi:hypothetical protein
LKTDKISMAAVEDSERGEYPFLVGAKREPLTHDIAKWICKHIRLACCWQK